MKIKLLIFDLDGVLVDSREIHYIALNLALGDVNEKYLIHRGEHLSRYDGLPTKEKLKLLTKEKDLPESLHSFVWTKKQEKTEEAIKRIVKRDSRLRNILSSLKKEGYLLYCASNSIWNTIKILLLQLDILEFFDFFISNEEVMKPKPSPEIYMQSMIRAGVEIGETLIFEDSHVGRRAALSSGARLCPISTPASLTLDLIHSYIKMAEISSPEKDLRWKQPVNVVIPMAGLGSRFSKVGYSLPKPLIDVDGIPMIELVVRNLNIDGKFIFIVRDDHYERYSLDKELRRIAPECEIIVIKEVTEGAACTVLLSKELINSSTPLLIANSDQFLEWNSNEFMYCSSTEGVDGCISTFRSNDPKWSFAKLDSNGFVEEVREKVPISDIATTGIYYWRKGSNFVKYAERMIEKNIRVNGEFYVCPVYNEAIEDGLKIKVKDCEKMWGIGTPEDLEFYLQNYRKE